MQICQINLPEKVINFLSKIEFNNQFQLAIKKCKQKINFSLKNITNLNPQTVKMIYKTLQAKYESLINLKQYETDIKCGAWQQNQLRLFIWFLACYIYLYKKKINQLLREDLQFLNQIFPHKKIEHLEYQIKLLTNKSNTKWKNQQCELFQTIMKSHINNKKWNFIAKELFIKSNKKYFKTPKQCRQRWLNHHDPTKKKSQWTPQQDLIILKYGNQPNRRWTHICKLLNDQRTQNSVKNRFNSLSKAIKKQTTSQNSYQQIVQKTINQMEKQINKLQQTMEPDQLQKQAKISAELKGQLLYKESQLLFSLAQRQQNEPVYNSYRVINNYIMPSEQKIVQPFHNIQEQIQINKISKISKINKINKNQQILSLFYEEQDLNEVSDFDCFNKNEQQIQNQELYRVIDITTKKQQNRDQQGIEGYLSSFNF